ncbi:general transcription factor II-I repeat domain-containing protein 2-like [Octopus bimaculoides]|uniref:general transcription factor II-I repeat domain-containing protein 2-like n=1 Tax=Octopus bimaculoides TaxID=37653 RepID=UPI00071DB9B6|nr:general transcription factor II-I repeat domain-containing protein 2-like [Octopus bimaculoides]|eukprot:XP_014783775.1 PREDICTED: general transcription factor II-I repeat domain-containing protein 2-like [Octopus bimaculoides]
MWQKIQAFRKKLFFKSLLAKSKLSEEHFPQFMNVMSEYEDIFGSFEEYKSVLDSLIEEYKKRFSDFEKHNITLKHAFQSHLVDVPKTPEELQMELIEMSEDNILKSQFDNRDNLIEIWEKAIEYPRLREHACRLISYFSTTYCCESTFSYLMQIKNSLRTQLTDEHLED